MTAIYDLFLESGPRRKKTMIHVIALLGCVANGPTTEEALAATPDAVAAYLRFLHSLGEPIDLAEPVELRVIDHAMEGILLGDGSPSISFAPDMVPLTAPELALYLRRYRALIELLAAWADDQAPPALADVPATGGRASGEILRHIVAAQGATLTTPLMGAPRFSRLNTRLERGELRHGDALREGAAMVEALLLATTPEQWAHVRELNGNSYTLRKAVRGLLEHNWNHARELARRPGGPVLVVETSTTG